MKQKHILVPVQALDWISYFCSVNEHELARKLVTDQSGQVVDLKHWCQTRKEDGHTDI